MDLEEDNPTLFLEDGSHGYMDHLQIRKTVLALDESLSVKEIHPSPEEGRLILSRKRKFDQVLSSATSSSTPAGETKITRQTSSSIEIIQPQNHFDDSDPSCMSNSLLVYHSNNGDNEDDNDDSGSSDPCHPDSYIGIPDVPPVLPPSTGDIGVPEDVVPFLFSVYNFLISFSHQLFLSPFGLDDFVGSLNCHIQNRLLDAIHVSLMRALRQHLKTIASERSHLAFRCLKLVDWHLLDSLTWPVFLMEYISIMHLKNHIKDYAGFQYSILNGEYYSLPVSSKLMVLQILCDSVVESVEIRDELEMRENMDEEKEHTFKPTLRTVESMPRRLHPRYSKTSAYRDNGDVENAAKEGLDGAVDVDKDGNSDECQLCRMDGTLICCDGCPSSYHSRCIGLTKTSLPVGSWFCPECLVRKSCPASSKISTGIRGGEIFGIDPFGRVFFGTCNYLVVFSVSHSINSISRYYSHKGILNVLKFLSVERETSHYYADIFHAISSYWDIPLANFLQPARTTVVNDPSVEKENTRITSYCSSRGLPYLKCHRDNYANEIPEISAVKEEASCQHHANSVSASCITDSLDGNKANQSSTKREMTCNEVSPMEKVEPGDEILSQTGEVSRRNASLISSNFLSTDSVCCDTSNASMNSIEKEKLPTNISNSQHLKSMQRDGSSGNHLDVDSYYDNKISYLGTRFKHQAYINQYLHGEAAASAAANLSFLSSEEYKASATQASSNPRRALAASVALQVKAFSGATMHFTWPSVEKKIMDVPRERCGWCISCKNASTCKKGCLLNNAVTNAVKGASKAISSIRLLKSENGHFHAIGSYILHMEMNLCGMIEGDLLDANYRNWWRKSVNEAYTCQDLKLLLLELERNICGITFSDGWLNLVDNWSVEHKSREASVGFGGTSQKRGIGGRRTKKHAVASEEFSIDTGDSGKEFQWWCGDRLAKKLFQRGVLPRLLAKRIARQGGAKHVDLMGICYPDHSETANRTRQIVWRAAVESSKNSSQLALQVRCLDAHIRWKDLVQPERNTFEEKTANIESSTFRNAVILEEKIVENKTRYALSFSIQTHLPIRVTKNILETEHYEDKEKLWFSENFVPLYLIKEYKEKMRRPDVAYSRDVIIRTKPELLKRRVISNDIFIYLFHKGKEPQVYSCVSCNSNVLLRNADTCMVCQGYCHKHCLITASDCLTGGCRHICVCRPCHSSEYFIPAENRVTILKDCKTPVPKIKEPSLINNFTTKVDSEMRARLSGLSSEREGKSKTKSRLTSGLIWKRKTTGDMNDKCGTDFRLKHLILRGNVQTLGEEPVCKLCSTSYNPDLMYIRCEHCLGWYHADSVQLEENQIFDLVGFRCCKCRRKASPFCPHSINTDKKLRSKPADQRNARRLQGGSIMEPIISNTKDVPKKCYVKSELLEGPRYSSSNSASSQAIYDDGTCEAPFAHSTNSNNLGEHLVFQMGDDSDKHFVRECSSLVSEADGTISNGEEKERESINVTLDYKEGNSYPQDLNFGEATEYEPQTYFSFTELLASEDEEFYP